jgi:hypothetical protein
MSKSLVKGFTRASIFSATSLDVIVDVPVASVSAKNILIKIF